MARIGDVKSTTPVFDCPVCRKTVEADITFRIDQGGVTQRGPSVISLALTPRAVALKVSHKCEVDPDETPVPADDAEDAVELDFDEEKPPAPVLTPVAAAGMKSRPSLGDERGGLILTEDGWKPKESIGVEPAPAATSTRRQPAEMEMDSFDDDSPDL